MVNIDSAADMQRANTVSEDTSTYSTQDALSWSGQFLNVQKSKQISNNPWGKTFKITHNSGIAYLKILPAALASAVSTTPYLAKKHPDAVPAVINASPDKRFILLAGHTGKDFKEKPSESDRKKILSTYAAIQADSANDSKLIAMTPALAIDTLVDDLVTFLTPGERLPQLNGAVIGADYFFSPSRCKTYASLISKRAPMLRKILTRARALPPTINHCDLRYANAAKDRQGNIILYDWDEAVAGPAGLSLHAMFSGCASIFKTLQPFQVLDDPEKYRQTRRGIMAYINTLCDNGYADAATLSSGLGPASLAGMIYYIIGFCRFEKNSDSYRRAVRRNLSKRLSDLLDVCDFICVSENIDVLEFADHYIDHGRTARAERILKQQLRLQPDNARAYFKLAWIRRKDNKLEQAIRDFRAGLQIMPKHYSAQLGMGKSLTCRGDYSTATVHLHRALDIYDSKNTRRYLQRVHELRRARNDADQPGFLPTVYFTREERNSGKMSPETLHLCDYLFRRHGTLLLKSVFDPDLLEACHESFLERYRAYLNNKRHKDALRIGDKRYQVTIDIVPPYNAASLYGNGLILPLMRSLLGKYCTLGCFTSAMSLPGAEDQRLHKDHKDLFYDDPDAQPIPSFAVTTMVPLVDLNETVGTTRVKKGTHKLTTKESESRPYQTPLTKVGDCYLMDYRLSHHGQANQSDSPRPILSMVYQRPWFRDYINFGKQPTLRISRSEFKRVPDDLKPLLDWTNEPGPR